MPRQNHMNVCMQTPAARLGSFLTALFGDSRGLIEMRTLPSRRRRFFPLSNGEALAVSLGELWEENLYFGVASRRDASSGELENCRDLNGLFAEFDFKMTPEPEVRAHLTTFPLAASIVAALRGENGRGCG